MQLVITTLSVLGIRATITQSHRFVSKVLLPVLTLALHYAVHQELLCFVHLLILILREAVNRAVLLQQEKLSPCALKAC